jgi:Leucine-rich repeat (LRR) protein
MSAVDSFSKLDRCDLSHIIRNAGTFSKLCKVNKLFHEVATKEAASLYAWLEEMFGKPCLGYILKKLEIVDKSDAAKIDQLFWTFGRDWMAEKRALICYDRNTLKGLELHMKPLLLAEGVVRLWESLSRIGHSELKSLMKQVKMGEDFLLNVDRMRDFFKEHSGELRKVSALHLNGKGLRVLPPEIRYFSTLCTLDLANNALEVLPEEIGCLKHLKELRLNYNRLRVLPKELGDLQALENLQCAFNGLKSVPSHICQLSKLRTLNLSGNRLGELPEKIGDLQALNYLYLESNSLVSLPDSMGEIPYLIGLYLFNNQISHLPDSLCKMGHLTFLSVQNNALEALPEEIGKMTSLKALLLDGNQIEELPPSLCALENLEKLFLSCNQIAKLPEAIGDLQQLCLFCVGGNPIQEYSSSAKRLPFWSLDEKLYPQPKSRLEVPSLNASMTIARFREVYWGLGTNKWKEWIDGYDHVHGPEVYDKGLHGRAVEPGFLSSMGKASVFLSDHCNQRVDADFYLRLHKEACGHFKGRGTCTLMGLEKVGVFRDLNDRIVASFSVPNYVMTESAVNEFNELNMKITLLFGSSFRIGDIAFHLNQPQNKTIHYFPLSKDQVRCIFNFFATEFYYDIGHAKNDDCKIRAIAKWIQRLEWLHPVRDGCGRTDTALLNYLLTVYGFNPVLLTFPYVSSCKGLEEWVFLLRQGMGNWRVEAGF